MLSKKAAPFVLSSAAQSAGMFSFGDSSSSVLLSRVVACWDEKKKETLSNQSVTSREHLMEKKRDARFFFGPSLELTAHTHVLNVQSEIIRVTVLPQNLPYCLKLSLLKETHHQRQKALHSHLSIDHCVPVVESYKLLDMLQFFVRNVHLKRMLLECTELVIVQVSIFVRIA